jgi:hypothetical protein
MFTLLALPAIAIQGVLLQSSNGSSAHLVILLKFFVSR